jgi:hypothetical protein
MAYLLGIIFFLHPFLALITIIGAPIYLFCNGHYAWGSVVIATSVLSSITCTTQFRYTHLKTDTILRFILASSPCMLAGADLIWILTPALWIASSNNIRDMDGADEGLPLKEVMRTYSIITGVIIAYLTIY